MSTILVKTRLCFSQNRRSSGRRAISTGFSSETISHRIPLRSLPANAERSTAASVCPSLVRTPPSRARNGKMWPGREKSLAVASGLANRLTVLARSVELIPVVMPVGVKESKSGT
jgi:hypothetical protein